MPIPSFIDWFRDHRADFDGVVMDMDGVLILGRSHLPGADRWLDILRQEDIPFCLLTNDGSRSKQERSDLLTSRGLSVPPSQIVTASDGLVELVEANPGYRDLRFYLFGKLGRPCYAEAAGLTVTRDLADLPACDGVICGEGEHAFDWETTFTAVINFFDRHPGGPFIVPNPDEYYPGHGELRVGAGGMARFIQSVLTAHGTPATMHYLGKPYGPIFQHVHHQLERQADRPLDPTRVLMMGDNLASDIKGGNDFGYHTMLMLTGITTPDRLAASHIRPEWVAHQL